MELGNHKSVNISYLSLFVTILAYLIFSPILTGFISSILLDLIFSLILISCLTIVGPRKVSFVFALTLAIPIIILMWISHFDNALWIRLIGNTLFLIYTGVTICVLLYHILHHDEMKLDLIYGAFCVYLLTGFFWGLLYSTIELVNPRSIQGIAPDQLVDFKDTFEALLYYSFVTLTTLGYGDMTPTTHLARNLSLIEAAMGQLYIATFVAGLVGKFSKGKSDK